MLQLTKFHDCFPSCSSSPALQPSVSRVYKYQSSPMSPICHHLKYIIQPSYFRSIPFINLFPQDFPWHTLLTHLFQVTWPLYSLTFYKYYDVFMLQFVSPCLTFLSVNYKIFTHVDWLTTATYPSSVSYTHLYKFANIQNIKRNK